MRREGFYETDQGKALKRCPRPGPLPASKVQSDPRQITEFEAQLFERAAAELQYKLEEQRVDGFGYLPHWLATNPRFYQDLAL